MTRRRKWLLLVVALVSATLAIRFGERFPWAATLGVLAAAQVMPLVIATLVNLASLPAKAATWQLLLRRDIAPRWRSTLDATVIGAAVGSVSIAASGDAARVHVLVQREPIGVRAAVSALVWSRVVEGVGLAALILGGAAFLRLPMWVRPVQVAAIVLLAATIVLVAPAVPTRRGHLVTLFGLGLVHWLSQWATYHFAIVSVAGATPLTASFMAVLAANIVGLPKLTPGNVGVMQASFVIALAPFGVPVERAVAAGLACQAIQVLPVLLAGVALAGWHGLRQAARESVRDAAPAEMLGETT